MAVMALEISGQSRQLNLAQIEMRPPGSDEVQLRMRVAGLSFADALMVRGIHHNSAGASRIPGTEGVGTIVAMGGSMRAVGVGDLVLVVSPKGGCFSEFATLKNPVAVKVGKEWPVEDLSVLGASYLTALYALKHKGHATRGETLLVLGATGALGQAAVELGKALGLLTIAAVRSSAGRERALSLGADAALDLTAVEFRDQLRQLSPTQGVDIVFDSVGGCASRKAVNRLNWMGRYLYCGMASGEAPEINPNVLLVKGATLFGVETAQFIEREPEQAQNLLEEVVELFKAGLLHPHAARAFPIDQYKLAFEALSDSTVQGRTVLCLNSLKVDAARFKVEEPE